MKHIFFLPGIYGSVLKRAGRTIWPPNLCKLFSDAEVRALQAADVTVGDVVRKVAVFEMYGPILDALAQAVAPDPGGFTFTPWPYDWRADLAATCAKLDATLSAVPAGDEIILVAHSMGGLVVRGCLEAQRPQAPSWLARVSLAVFLATPHDGAVKAIATILGNASVPGLTRRQSAMLSGDHRYPSGYELISGLHDPVFWSGPAGVPEDFAADATWRALGLDLAFKPIVDAFRNRLDATRRPATCRYVAVASAAHTTMTHMERDDPRSAFAVAEAKTSGDGTVAIPSATALRCQTLFVTGNHVGVTQSAKTHAFVVSLLGVPQNRFAAFIQRAATVPTLSISPQFAQTGETIELVIKPADGSALDGAVHLTPVVDGEPRGDAQSIAVHASAGTLEVITFTMPAPSEGQYLARYVPADGEPSNAIALVVRPADEAPAAGGVV